MTYKSILVHAEHLAAAEPRLAVAAALARRFDATLVGLGAESLDWAGVSDPYGIAAGQWLAVVAEQIQVDLASAEKAFRRYAKDLNHEWLALREAPDYAMARLSRSADLIVAGGAPLDDTGQYRTAAPADLVLLSGRPVLVAPPTGHSLRAEQIIVAWTDSREARRALTDAMPFLRTADGVTVLEICADDDLENAKHQTGEVARHLKRHGVKATAKTKVAHNSQVAGAIYGEARAQGADLIVSGAYGHNRFQELVLGGVTRDLLRNPEQFVLLSH